MVRSFGISTSWNNLKQRVDNNNKSTNCDRQWQKIIVPRNLTIFLLFGIVLFFGLLLIYPFKIMFLFSLIYLCFIPISSMHYLKSNKIHDTVSFQDDDHEDIL